jgi:Pyruvate phosphate dikinase, AMP/ATP-binding domain
MRDLLGGKGANVAEMLRVPGQERVPAGFTITTAACVEYIRVAREPDGQVEQVREALARLQSSRTSGSATTRIRCWCRAQSQHADFSRSAPTTSPRPPWASLATTSNRSSCPPTSSGRSSIAALRDNRYARRRTVRPPRRPGRPAGTPQPQTRRMRRARRRSRLDPLLPRRRSRLPVLLTATHPDRTNRSSASRDRRRLSARAGRRTGQSRRVSLVATRGVARLWP